MAGCGGSCGAEVVLSTSLSLEGAASTVGCEVVVVSCTVVVGVGVSACCEGVSVLCLRRGACMIMRSICRCVRLSRFSSSLVSVQASAPYKMVGVTVPWKSRRRSFREYLLLVSSCLYVYIYNINIYIYL